MSSGGEAASSLRVFTWDEIDQHNTAESLWVVIEGQVYDVTQFQEEHPGGREVLLENAARDATNAFTDVGHSPDAIELKKQYLIGVVGSKSSGPPVAAQPTAQPAAAASSTTTASSAVSRAKEVAMTVLPVVVVAGIAIGIGFLLYRRFKK